jgi:hypothetical protein
MMGVGPTRSAPCRLSLRTSGWQWMRLPAVLEGSGSGLTGGMLVARVSWQRPMFWMEASK